VSDSIVVVFKGRKTRITVKDWPSRYANLRVQSEGDRKLQVVGFANWDYDQVVGRLTLHVDKTLLITDYWLADSLLKRDRPRVLTTLVACAEEIAIEMSSQRRGTGYLEWQLDRRKLEFVEALFRDFEPCERSWRLRRRGMKYLRKRCA